MGDLIKNSRTVTFSGGNSLGLTQTTILYGKGQNITDIDYDKITINPLVFIILLLKKKYYMILLMNYIIMLFILIIMQLFLPMM